MTNTCKCGHDEENHYLGTDGCANCYKVDKYLCTKFEPMNDEFAEAINNPDFIAKAIKDSNQAQIDLVAKANEKKDFETTSSVAKEACTCGEPHISQRIQHCYNGKPCYVKEVLNETKTESVEEKQKQFPSYWQRELEIDYIHAVWLVGEFRTEISKAEQRGREEGYKDGYIDGEKAGHIDKKWDIVMNIAKNALKGDEPK